MLFIFGIMTDVKWDLKIFLIWISLRAKDIEHDFKFFSSTWDSSSESVLYFMDVDFFKIVSQSFEISYWEFFVLTYNLFN